MRRRNLLETLEARQLLAGPQLIGIQPNEGDLIDIRDDQGRIVNNPNQVSVLDLSPRLMTFRFDDNQRLDPATLDAVQFLRAGDDGELGTADDVKVTPGAVTLGDPNENEIVVRFAESLPDDEYRINIFGFDDPSAGIVGLRNVNGELLEPSVASRRVEVIDFRLDLGALIEAVVPQPVVRNADGTLTQNRNEVVVYFNEDPLFVENDSTGNPTARSAENPRFYQLILTNDTVSTQDDEVYEPVRVVYDEDTFTARLFFETDINELENVPVGGGTFRLRIGAAVGAATDLKLQPSELVPTPSVAVDLDDFGTRMIFRSRLIGENQPATAVVFENSGLGGLQLSLVGGELRIDFGGGVPLASDIEAAVNSDLQARNLFSVEIEGSTTQPLPGRLVGAEPFVLVGLGDTFTTASDLGLIGNTGSLQSFLISESISAQTTSIVLPGGNEDPGSRQVDTDFIRHLNPAFLPNAGNGITEVAYNFSGILATVGDTSFINQITERQQTRIREALDLWSNRIGVQFRETQSEGITFGVGDSNRLEPLVGTTVQNFGVLDASLRIDPSFQNSAIIFNNQVTFGTAYAEDFTRKAAAGIGLLLGLEFAPELPPESLLTGTSQFLEDTINPTTLGALNDLEPVFPGNYDVLHGQYLHQPDSVDIDLFRFEVSLDDADRLGTLTVETFAERLAESSLLDTTIRLFEEVTATATTDFNLGPSLQVEFSAVDAGRLGNGIRIEFVESDRVAGDTAVRVLRLSGDNGEPLDNAILLDIPRRGRNITSVPVSDLINAVNSDAFASQLVTARLVTGTSATDISSTSELILRAPLELTGGGLVQLARNDDYFSEDSFLRASLGQGVYYIGVSASGNDTYDPEVPDSGFGGLTQGKYEVLVKFDPNVDEENVLRDRDGLGNNLPGTPIDGDNDGRPGGVNQFWFQTRPEERILQFDLGGSAITPNQTIRIVSGSGVIRTYEFVPVGGVQRTPGSNVVIYNATLGASAPPESLASALISAIQLTSPITGVTAAPLPNGTGNQIQLFGERSVQLSSNARGMTVHGKTIFVDKTGPTQAAGSLLSPINNIASTTELSAFSIALPGDQVRIVGNGGDDGRLETENDNYSYQFGVREIGGGLNEDGANMEVPKGVTTMVDAGAILKFRSARIGVGSSSLQIDRSGSLLQILGTPRLVQLSTGDDPSLVDFDPITTLVSNTEVTGGYQDGSVILTSMRDRLADSDAAGSSPVARPGDWGGIVYRSDFDRVQGRFSLEDEGIFVDRVNHAEFRFGGGSNVLVDSQQQLVNPITMFSRRPTISFNEITRSADAAISASPDTFEETTFQSPVFQASGAFIADYSRSGPDVFSNTLVNNSINGMFIRIATGQSQPPRTLTVAGRFDDIDVVHHLAENLIIEGTPGGSISDGIRPELVSSSGQILPGGDLAAGAYRYKMTFVDEFGFESEPSDASGVFTVPSTLTGEGSSIELRNLPAIGGVSNFVSRRLYRSIPGTLDDFVFIARLDASGQTFVDDGSRNLTNSTRLDPTLAGIRGRLDASLTIDPGLVIKLNGARIELGHGTQLLAEGTDQLPIVLTSLLDDRYGFGGTFDTNNDGDVADPQRGNWAGIYAGPGAHVGLDSAVIAYGGGISPLAGGLTRGYVPLQLQQATGRVVNTRFEFNQSGQAGAGPIGRFGSPGVTPSVIHVRGSQPTIVGNEFVDNRGSVIDIDSNSFNAERIVDLGRETGEIDRLIDLDDNFGPLIRDNSYRIVASQAAAQQQFSGMEIRGGQLTTESIWDDTDIVHMLFDSITVGNFHSSGGLRLMSRAEESLVVKLSGEGNGFSPTFGTGLTATGTVGDIENRIGGTVQVIGMPGSPVILTSFQDDTVGGGLELDGTPFTDTNGDSFGSRPEPNDWRSVLFDQHSNLTNMEFILERELDSERSPGLNGSVTNAQTLGQLATSPITSDEQQRLGFEVEGFLSQANDVDTYAFLAQAGTQIWIDVDATSFTLDTIVEVLDPDGTVVARSNNSRDEVAGTATVDALDPSVEGLVGSLKRDREFDDFLDFNSVNPRDAGLRMTLPGPIGENSTYFVRIRSASMNPDDATGGLTKGGYRFQLRTHEEQAFSGSMVRFADIRYSNHGIHVRGGMSNSPLLGDAQENEQLGALSSNDSPVTSLNTPGQRAQYLGNLLQSRDGSFSVGGQLSTSADIDFYQIDVNGALGATGGTTVVFDIDYADGFNRPDTMLSLFYDPDGERGPLQPRLVAIGNDSNILEDQGLPNGDPLDLLSRGSIDTGDAYIGPVTLPGGNGTYYIAVSGEGTVPEVLTDPLVRLEPVDSVIRIFDDQVNSLLQTTALPPREVGPFIDTQLLPFGWSVTTDLALNIGHNLRQTFNGSRPIDLYPSSIQVETESNDSFLTADSLETVAGWSLNDDPNVGNNFGTNTSQLFPHTKVLGQTFNEVVDVFQFDVTEVNSTVILDIDEGFNPSLFTSNPGLAGINVGNRDISTLATDSVNLKLQLFDVFGNLLATSSLAPADDGALGSTANPLSLFSEDPFIQTTLQPGQYFVAVSPEATTYDPVTGVFTLPVANRPRSGTYELNVSVEQHAVIGGDPNNESLYFDRSEFRGDLDSESFDLVGYTDADQPMLYFDYLLRDVGNDAVRVTVRSDQQPNAVVVIGNTEGVLGADPGTPLLQRNGIGSWFQARIDLGAFAGDTGVTVQFQYDTDFFAGEGPTLEGNGLYIDNFIVGFAERGELVTGAPSARLGFTGQSQTVTGEYQLEIRSGQAYRDTGLVNAADVSTTFDTNDRLSRSMTLVAPLPNQIVDGNTFSLSDNVREVTFEFNRTGSFTAGNIPIDISAALTRADVAEAIQRAINLPAVQAFVQIQATDIAGQTDGSSRDVRVALSGVVSGDFIAVDSLADAPQADSPLAPGGGVLPIAAIYSNMIGDANVVRTQDQVIIDSNRISDVHTIGIYSEPADRDVDPQDIKFPPEDGVVQGNFFNFNTGNVNVPERFLQQPPIGNSTPGAVRNLPTLNDSVIGGLTPGISIVNNTIDSAGYAGIRVEGQLRPFVIDSGFVANDFILAENFGDQINDGLTMTLDASGTRVTFEFEEITGDVTPAGGSGQAGGDGYVDGHVPIYYRRTFPTGYNNRSYGSTRHEVMMGIQQAVLGSILVTNDLVQLVKPTIGPSIQFGSELEESRYLSEISFPTPAVYLEGVTGVYFDSRFQKVGGGNPFTVGQAAIGEAAQPFAKIVNNTIYGQDGTESTFQQAAITQGADGDDTLAGAVRTQVGQAHASIYTTTATIGNGNTVNDPRQDADIYEVELRVGDRLIVDIDTIPGAGPDTFLQLFNENGVVIASNAQGLVPDHLETSTDPTTFDSTIGSTVDPFLDFTATVGGTYYVSVTSQGNESFDPNSISGRDLATGGLGDYTIAIEAYAARQFVFSIDNDIETRGGGNLGTTGPDLDNAFFTITQVADRNDPLAVPGTTNTVRFEFNVTPAAGVGGYTAQNVNGQTVVTINVQPGDGHRVPELMVGIAGAINDFIVGGFSLLGNHDRGNGPIDAQIGAVSGPIDPVLATPLGGVAGDGVGSGAFGPVPPPYAGLLGGGVDYQYGFGHDRLVSVGSTFNGTTEMYLLIENAAKMEVSGLPFHLDPLPGRNTDQLLPEHGVLMAGGSSGVIFNNVFSNLHISVDNEETRRLGFNTVGPDLHPKKGEVVVTSNAFQHDQPANNRFRDNINSINNGTGIVQDPSNVNGGTDDFNVTLGGNDPLFVHAAGDNFLPALRAEIIDTGITSVLERDRFGAVKQSVGLPINNVLAPRRDGIGVLRADNDAVAPPSGLGGSLFLDLGANERADFNGPVAIILNPLDNDPAGLDADGNDTFIDRPVGGLSEFIIQLRDTGDSADPFTGVGLDGDTVIVSELPGLRKSGDNVTVFENDRLLVEGIDYRIRFDEVSNNLFITPIAGIWRNDRSYRIMLNNRDRNVLIAPSPDDVEDGDQIRITDSDGGTVVFEFETGYQLSLPEPLTLVVPELGTDVGGIRDGDIFQVANGTNNPVVFEFDVDGVRLPGSIPITLPSGPTPIDAMDKDDFLRGIAESIREALISPRTDSLGNQLPAPFDFDVKVVREPELPGDNSEPDPVVSYRVVLGAEPGTTVNTSAGGLQQLARTLALSVPTVGGGAGGIQDGETFTISDGSITRTFEFDADDTMNDPNAIRIEVASLLVTRSGLEIADSIAQAIIDSPLSLTPSVNGTFVALNLPANGVVTTSPGQTRVVGLSRPVNDGDIIRISRQAEASSQAIEINGFFPSGLPVDNSPVDLDDVTFTVELQEGNNVAQQFVFEFDSSGEVPPVVGIGNTAIDVTELITPEGGTPTLFYVSTDELTRRIAAALVAKGIDLSPIPQDEFVFITVPDGQTLTLDSDFLGIGLTDEAQFIPRQTLEFHLRSDVDPTGADVTPGHIPVVYDLTDTSVELAERVSAILNATAVSQNEQELAGLLQQIATAEAASEDAQGVTNSELFQQALAQIFAGREIPTDPITDEVISLLPGLLNTSERTAPGQISVAVDTTNPVLLTVTDTSSLVVQGEPGVSGGSTVQVLGPLLLNIPTLGGVSVINGSILVLTDDDGNDVVFQFSLANAPFNNIRLGANVITYSTNDTPDVLATALAASINASTAGLPATVVNGTQVSLGRIDRTRVSNTGLPGFAGASAIGIQTGIVSDGEILRIRQGDISVSYEFDSVENGGGVQPGNVQVSFQPNSSPGDIAESLAAAIRNNPGGLRFTPGPNGEVFPIAETDENGVLTGGVILNDLPGTQVDISAAPTLNVTGVPGGAIPITISPLFSSEAIKQVLLRALNNVNRRGEDPTTTIFAEDRGGNSLFLNNAQIVEGPIDNFLLPAIKDKVGNNLEANRDDQTTQFTINLSDIALDFGDAPDPVGLIPGRYPTRLRDNGARHVVGSGPLLGRSVDSELDALSVQTADGDDLTIVVGGGGGLFANRLENGVVKVDINPTNVFDVTVFDGETFTIDTGPQVATFEFDTDGIFNEDNFVIWPRGYQGERVLTAADSALLSEANIALGIENSIEQSPINPASVRTVTDPVSGLVTVEVSGDDEDGVKFTSPDNPLGIFNPSPGSVTPIEITVNGEGVLEAWIDFNADGDWDDPGELIISPDLEFPEGTPNPALFGPGETIRTYNIEIPSTTRTSTGDTYARFRVSRNGTGSPVGLALSGEVEDYRVRIVNGTPPTITDTSLSYDINEGGFLQASDDIGIDQFTNNDGLLVGVQGEFNPVSNSNRTVEIFAADIGERELYGANGELAGVITIARNGTFTFDATDDFAGEARFLADGTPFSVRVTDIRPNAPGDQLVGNERISVVIRVAPVNDPPTLRPGIVPSDVLVTRTINEDNVNSQQDQTIPGPVVFNASELITPFYVAGPGTEPAEQELVFFSAGIGTTAFRTLQGGTLSIGSGGRTINYTPPANYNGPDPDVFTYTVSDRLLSTLPGSIVSETAQIQGRVEIVINAINDNPIVIGESYQTLEDQPITIPIFGVPGGLPGILDNDEPGPPDEKAAPARQTISLKPNQFTSIQNGQIVPLRRTPNGGTIRQVGDNLIYTPLTNFSGTDRFTYIVVDSAGAESTATATIAVGDINKPPVFSGVRGQRDGSQQPVTRIDLNERTQSGELETYDLNSWFTDPDGDSLSYSIASVNNTQLIQPSISGDVLSIELSVFRSGTTSFTITATDPSGLSVSQPITVNVASSADAPIVAGSFDPTRVLEGSVFTGDLKRELGENDGLFLDVDGDNFSYRVVRLGNLSNPTASQIAAHPLVRQIEFVGDSVRIVPQPFKTGSVVIELEVFDGTFVNSHSFTYIVDEIATAPIGNFTGDDAYTVPLGGVLRITDPNLGLLRNDFDPDPGSTIRVDAASLTQPVGGTGTVSLLGRTDGAFSFTTSNGPNRPVAGQTDTFTYRLIDNTGRLSQPITVSITFNQSNFQNPIDRYDVTADGFVTAVDALRIINLLNERNGSVNVSDLETTPPDYYDVSGDGVVTAVDVLQVINELNNRDVNGNNGSSEPIPADAIGTSDFGITLMTAATDNSADSIDASRYRSLASTQAYATVSGTNLGTANREAVKIDAIDTNVATDIHSSVDSILTGGLELQSRTMNRAEEAVGSLASNLRSSQSDESESSEEAFDSALADLFSEFS
ncbi:hypothetical protein Pla100_07090 [Neorhodopirellula pilleata]|uniref:GEVED domain-containing protein n=2 Tax=Neorhodopirellula pilleata TaxID=2714738 RepID=A0A5C6AX92_9BACT|nr:hypothetical protein Pla100_07090 [Neorhodopirellula pilleata]